MSDRLHNPPPLGIRFAGRRWPSFQLCGLCGLAAAILLSMALVRQLDLSPWLMAGQIVVAVATFLCVVYVRKLVSGEERITYYHHEIAVTLSAWLFLNALHAPALPYLDVTLLGVGLFLAFGRIGCLLVGCCHGSPFRWGVRYGEEHAAAGFTAGFVGVPLFPVQVLEAAVALLIVARGEVLALRAGVPGSAFTWYIIAYGAARFLLELLRGDPDRPFWAGLSQPQWFSLACMASIAAGESAGKLPHTPWHGALTLGMVLLAGALVARRRFGTSVAFRLAQPRHLAELAGAMRHLFSDADASQSGVRISATSLGIRISGGVLPDRCGPVRHYCISRRDGPIPRRAMASLARIVSRLADGGDATQILPGNGGVIHVILWHGPTSSRATPSVPSTVPFANPSPVERRF